MEDPVRQPLVSIVTPAYDSAEFIEETLDSVLRQDYPAIEYIVLDDGSADATPEILGRYGRRLTWVRHGNVGEHETVNRGWQMARGEILATVNADDPLLPSAVTEAVRFLDDHPDVLAAYPDYVLIAEDSSILGCVRAPEFDYAEMVRRQRCFPGPGTFFRREALRRVGLRDPRFKYAADFDYWLRVGLVGRMAHIPRLLATYRVHPGSLSFREAGDAMAVQRIELVERFFSRGDLPEGVVALKREALGNALAVAAAQAHRMSYFRALRYYARSFRRCPAGWFRLTGAQTLGRLARILAPHPVIERVAARRWKRSARSLRVSTLGAAWSRPLE